MSIIPLLPAVFGGLFFPDPSSTTAAGVDRLFYFILGICIVFFALIVGLMVYFVLRYRAASGYRPAVVARRTTRRWSCFGPRFRSLWLESSSSGDFTAT